MAIAVGGWLGGGGAAAAGGGEGAGLKVWLVVVLLVEVVAVLLMVLALCPACLAWAMCLHFRLRALWPTLPDMPSMVKIGSLGA